jgi:histidinol-phosphate aminotransferase
MRTFSKIGLAGMRVGFTVSSKAIAGVLEKVRPPYNVSSLDQRAAEFALEHAMDWCDARAGEVVAERGRLADALVAKGFEVFPSAANLLLVRVPSTFGDAPALYAKLLAAGITVRFFGTAGPLAGCVRITVGTPAENASLLAVL